jgi:hypothetical protein
VDVTIEIVDHAPAPRGRSHALGEHLMTTRRQNSTGNGQQSGLTAEEYLGEHFPSILDEQDPGAKVGITLLRWH